MYALLYVEKIHSASTPPSTSYGKILPDGENAIWIYFFSATDADVIQIHWISYAYSSKKVYAYTLYALYVHIIS